jgi:hypothetical protein
MLDPVGATFNRRTVYRTWVRSGRSQFLDVFDCPDPSAQAPKRAVTTTPLQALSMLNNSFVLRMADQFAAHIEGSTEANAQIKKGLSASNLNDSLKRPMPATGPSGGSNSTANEQTKKD